MQMESNYAKAANFIESAALQGAHLAVLPEYHLLGWTPAHKDFKHSCSLWQTYLSRYQSLAKAHQINIVPGTILELLDQGLPSERIENVAYFITSTGEIAGRYVKKNLWGPIERQHLFSSSTDLHPVMDTPLGKVGLLICWDLAFPEAFRELIAQGAKIVIIPTFWTLNDCTYTGKAVKLDAEALFLNSMLTARCFENTCAIVFANAGGPLEEGYAGLSQVCVPFAGPLTRLETSAEGMAIADLDMKVVEYAEEAYQVRSDLARSDWYYKYRHQS
ncbi:carbon-nitrogen hydrolase [Piedraia hortae CBS 480.64]|uniref:Carbon-nitrogen hydrolase n=1 Tax=Piedraia hortae CBS 480.64 TaxID=1314780 RepID=A0A6A7C948_9PEZI|nr:carbon-nitrogen hydrolase [Piedraia hortae CBS 480.64]